MRKFAMTNAHAPVASGNHGKEKQTLLGEFRTKYDAVKRLADTIELHHFKAYTDAATGLLSDKEGNIDYQKLKDANIRSSMADKMADFYVSKAKEYFKVDDKASKLSDMQKEMLLSTYAGITRGQLKSAIHNAEDEFTLETFKGLVSKIKQNVHNQLRPSAFAHISGSKEHKKSVLKEMGLEGKIDAELVELEDVNRLMETYHVNGGVLPPKEYQKLAAYKATQNKQPAAAGTHH